ncbi:MAG: PD-(D/E)XK nuclease family protein, partial [Myxococcota bacterium]
EARGRGFSAAALAEILADAPAGSPLARYADRVGTLAWPQLAGHLRGFIDAVFCDGERYFVVDYKSNHLGARQADYLPERLVQPMIESDYVLQYLLYTVAVDRHLASRIVGYDYERHFGGALYLFLRGLSEGHAPGCGVFFDRPDPEIVRRVSALLGGPSGGGR